MKFLRFLLRFTLSLILAVLLIAIGLYISGNGHVIKAVRSTYLVGKTGPTILDQDKFENRYVKASKHRLWSKSENLNSYQLSKEEEELLSSWETTALLIVQDNQLLFEQYWDGFDQNSYSNSFSVAKSLVSIALGAAIEKGCIESTNQYVHEFLEEFNTEDKKDIKIIDLLQMASGIDFGESYGDPFGFMARTYYGQKLYDQTLDKKAIHKAGEVWKYQGGNTLVLSFIIEKACGKNLSDFFSEEVWQVLGASQDALWTITPGDGYEKSYCCFYSNARDFARVGQLMLDSGQWNGRQIISKEYFTSLVQAGMKQDEKGTLISHYASHWWLANIEGEDVFYARGILGQYIVVVPEWDLILVRLGHKRDPNVGAKVPVDLFDYMKIAKKIQSN